jgi:hypothetical protein
LVIKESRTIHLDFSIESKDMFRANLRLAKWRLLVGLAFTVFLISGLVLLFIVIDERTILLQTSPLFIGLPLVAVGGQVLRLHAICRKYVAGLTETQRRTQYAFYEDGDGYDVISGESFAHISWQDVLKITELRDSFQIHLNKYHIRIIPKRGFHQASDIEALRRVLVSAIDARAHLLKPEAELQRT